MNQYLWFSVKMVNKHFVSVNNFVPNHGSNFKNLLYHFYKKLM